LSEWSVASFIIGAPMAAWGVYTGGYCLGVYENRWVHRRLRHELGLRPDPLFDPSDPEAVFVSLMPRDSFVRVKWTSASDVLLMFIDEKRKEILLEGDCDRYRIPIAANTICEPQLFFHAIDKQHQNELWMVRLMVKVPDGIRELLLSVDPNCGWRPRP